MTTFNIKLKELRIEKNLTQKEVSDILKISRTTYAGYEQGYREPDLETLKKICYFFNVSLDFLIGINILEKSNYDSKNLNNKEKNLINNYNKLDKRKQNLVDAYIDTMLEFEQEEQQRSKKYGG